MSAVCSHDKNESCWPVGVCYESLSCYARAAEIADKLSLPLLAEKCDRDIIICSHGGVLLQTRYGNIKVDFNSARWHYRLARVGQERLVRALGRKGGRVQKRVFDFTCGLCRDSFILAAAGFNLVSFELNPVLSTLVEDGLRRASLHDNLCSVAEKITFVAGDALQFTGDYCRPDIIYIDPMFTVTNKKAKVKKELQVIRALQKDAHGEEKLFGVARSLAKERVVVKRASCDPFFGKHKPSYSVTGKIIRFDVYLA